MDIRSAIRFQRYIVLLNKIWTKHNITLTRSSSSTALDLAYRIHGPSPSPESVPIVVLHGFLGSKRNWESICKNMTAHTNKTVIAVDARNHGDSPHSASHTYDDLADDVSKLISKFSISKAIVIGHSMGGRTGMLLALKEPSKVASLIVVDISPVSTSSGLGDFFPNVMAVMDTVDFRGMDTLYKARNAAKDTITKSGLFNNEQDMHFILMNIGKLSDNSFGWKCNLDALKKNFHYVASFPKMNKRNYMGPTLFVGGKLSYFIPPDDIIGIRKLFPKAHLQYIEEVGHNVHAENPKAFFTTVMQFFSFISIYQTQV